ncbi:unnamed protein product [Brassica oleracea var. botrytis]
MGSGYYQRRMDRRSAMYGVYSEKIRKIGIIGEQDSVSIILKMKSNVFKGNIFHSLQLSISFEGKGICGMNGRFYKIGIWRVGNCWFMEMRFWIYWFIETVYFGIQLCFVIGFQSVNYGFDITMEYLPNIRLAKWNGYKRMMGFFLYCITPSRGSASKPLSTSREGNSTRVRKLWCLYGTKSSSAFVTFVPVFAIRMRSALWILRT